MATSIAEKLLIKPETTVWASDPERMALVEPLPPGARVVERTKDASTVLVFGESGDSLREVVAAQAGPLLAADTLWVAYPKGNRADIDRDSVWPILAEHGLRPIAQISLGDVWSALRFRPLRPGEEQFTGGKAS